MRGLATEAISRSGAGSPVTIADNLAARRCYPAVIFPGRGPVLGRKTEAISNASSAWEPNRRRNRRKHGTAVSPDGGRLARHSAGFVPADRLRAVRRSGPAGFYNHLF